MVVWMMVAAAAAQTMNVSAATLLPVDEVLVNPNELAGYGVEQVLLPPEGGAFGVATVVFQMEWPEGVDSWNIEQDDVTLAVGDERIQAAGVMDWGRYKASSPSRRVRPSNTHPERTWGFVFPLATIPSDASLVVGEQTVPLTVQPKALRTPSVAESVSVEVTGTEVLDALSGSIRRGDFNGTTAFRPSMGRIVAVDLKLTPSAANKETGGFFWQTSDLSLAWEGDVTPPLGQWFMNKVSTTVSHNPSVDETPHDASRLLFVVPDGVSTATLRFHGEDVATVTIGS